MRPQSSPPGADVHPAEIPARQGKVAPPAPWPRSYSLVVVLITSFVFGALSYLPFIASLLFYPAGSLVGASGYLNRSPVGNILQVLYGFALLGLGYVIGKKTALQGHHVWLFLSAYFGSVLGYIIGLPGLDTTTVSGGIFLFETNILNAAHVQSAFFNSATLMGLLVAGIGLSSLLPRRDSAFAARGAEPTSTRLLAALFVVTASTSFLAFMLPPAFLLLFDRLAGSSAAAGGFLYTFQTNSIVIANPLLFFVFLYLVGSKVNVFRDATKVLVVLFIAVLVGVIAGNPLGSYATIYISSGMWMFPNYLANATTLATFLAAALDVSFAGAFLGFAATYVSARKQVQTGQPVARFRSLKVETAFGKTRLSSAKVCSSSSRLNLSSLEASSSGVSEASFLTSSIKS